jgi:hypothetical protein
MSWLNEYEVGEAIRSAEFNGQFGDDHPNALKGAQVLDRLMRWTNSNSDGWPYWKLPSNAAKRLMEALYVRYFSAYDKRVTADMTDAELKAALTPIRSFLRRHGVTSAVELEILGVAR